MNLTSLTLQAETPSLTMLYYIFLAIIILMILASAIKVVREYERGVIFRRARAK